jgi:protein-tyrosine phosphatase
MAQNDRTEHAARRVPPLQGGLNFRDIGGYRAQDGRAVRWGKLYRSGSMGRLTQTDYDTLAGLGIKSVCDLRTQEERAAEPNAWADVAGVNYWCRNYANSLGELHRVLTSELAKRDDARAAMIAIYRRLPFEQAPAYREVFARLGSGDFPLVFNCTAGKDRTGTLAALVLGALGVPRDTIVEDYALTNIMLDRNRFTTAAPQGQSRISSEVGAAALEAHPSYIAAAFDSMEEKHGSIEGYLAHELALDASGLAQLREALLE